MIDPHICSFAHSGFGVERDAKPRVGLESAAAREQQHGERREHAREERPRQDRAPREPEVATIESSANCVIAEA